MPPVPLGEDGTVVEVCQFDQYPVRVDSSRCVALENRKFLLRYIPVQPQQQPLPMQEDFLKSPLPFATPFTPVAIPSTPCQPLHHHLLERLFTICQGFPLLSCLPHSLPQSLMMSQHGPLLNHCWPPLVKSHCAFVPSPASTRGEKDLVNKLLLAKRKHLHPLSIHLATMDWTLYIRP